MELYLSEIIEKEDEVLRILNRLAELEQSYPELYSKVMYERPEFKPSKCALTEVVDCPCG